MACGGDADGVSWKISDRASIGTDPKSLQKLRKAASLFIKWWLMFLTGYTAVYDRGSQSALM